MAEEIESGEGEAGTRVDPVATAMALGSASRERADAFLNDQRALIADQRRLADEQIHHLKEQFKQLRLSIWQQRMGVLLRVATAAVGVVVAGLFGLMVWDASRSSGLLIEPFSVPPDLAAHGISGEVAAARFLDKLQAMQAATGSDRPASSFQNNWGSELKVEIPQTGLTFGELDNLLREKLGHASHVTGEVIRTDDGIAVTARLGDMPPQTFGGAEGKFDDLAQQAAEAIYRSSQPYRFAQYLEQHGRIAEAFAVISDLASHGPAGERSWAYAQWSLMDLDYHGDTQAAREHGLAALARGGAAIVDAEIALTNEEVWSGHDEQAFRYSIDLAAKSRVRTPEQTQAFFDANRLVAAGWLDDLTGDYDGSSRIWLAVEKMAADQDMQSFTVLENINVMAPALAVTSFALNHDPAAKREFMVEKAQSDDDSLLAADAENAFLALPHYWPQVQSGNWSAALADARAVDGWLTANKAARPQMGLLQQVWIHPLEALALARTGDGAGAAALIRTTPLDCYLCLRLRGQIAALAGDGAAADRWFAAAVNQAPSLPFAYANWGEVLLARGNADEAIAKFALAKAKSPHFADPLEMWGEALMAKNQSHLALAKFTEAGKYAPSWGRLHLKWGEAFWYAGKKDDARKEFAKAAALDLTAAEKAELARHMGGTATLAEQ